MGVNNNGSGKTKADLILTKVEGLAQQNKTLDAKVSKVIAATSDKDMDIEAIIQKLAADNKALLQEIEFLSAQIQSIYKGLSKDITGVAEKAGEERKEINIDELSSKVAEKIIIPQNELDLDLLADKVAERLPVAETTVQVDLDELAEKVAAKIALPETAQVDVEELAEKIAAKLTVPEVNVDPDALGLKVAESLYIPTAIVESIDYDQLAEKVAAKLTVPEVTVDPDALGLKVAESIYIPSAIVEGIDYDQLAEKLAAHIPAQEVISPDYVASQVVDQLVIPTVDEDALAAKVIEKIGTVSAAPVEVTVDEDRIACSVAEKIRAAAPESEQPVAEAYAEAYAPVETAPVVDTELLAGMVAERISAPAAPELDLDALAEKIASKLNIVVDDEEIADCIAKKVGTISPEQFDVMVDDDGCDSLAKAIESKLDYDAITAAVVERVGGSFASPAELDVDELARQLSEKIGAGVQINEDALADKAAAVLSNFIPEVDTDEIAEKVVAGVVPSIPQVEVDAEGIASSVAEKIAEKQEEQDFDIVIDEEGLEKLTCAVSQKIKGEYDERFNKVDEDIAKIQALAEVKGEYDERFNKVDEDIAKIQALAEVKGEYDERFNKVDEDIAEVKELAARQGAQDIDIVLDEEGLEKVTEAVAEKVKGEYDGRFDSVDGEIDEIKRMLAAGVVAVAASDEIAAAAAVAEEEPAVEEELVTVSDIVEEQPVVEDEEQDEVIEEIVDDIDETPVDGEVLPDGIPGISNSGVDFANMMKYNRSFIARIIQGSDEQKQYYGQIKNALLSYKKVNSNVSWGAERFNKGRETIARFKIRGKTLCLYLALDPNEYPTSVYHHVDVSDNKSMSGTPMMVKIKSPRGAKKAIRLIDEMLEKRQGIKQHIAERDYAAMYPYESIEELIEDGLVKDVSKK